MWTSTFQVWSAITSVWKVQFQLFELFSVVNNELFQMICSTQKNIFYPFPWKLGLGLRNQTLLWLVDWCLYLCNWPICRDPVGVNQGVCINSYFRSHTCTMYLAVKFWCTHTHSPCNVLKLTGPFSLGEAHSWVRTILPDIPDQPSTEDTITLYFKSTFIDTQLEAVYT